MRYDFMPSCRPAYVLSLGVNNCFKNGCTTAVVVYKGTDGPIFLGLHRESETRLFTDVALVNCVVLQLASFNLFQLTLRVKNLPRRNKNRKLYICTGHNGRNYDICNG